MKTIRKNLLLLAFAAGALFLIGNNVFADPPDNQDTECPDDPEGGGIRCTQYEFDDQILKLKTCILPWQQKLICSPFPDKCCKADSQRACSGSGWPF